MDVKTIPASDIEIIASRISPAASDYAWHLMAWGGCYPKSKYYRRSFDSFCKVMALQLGTEPITIEIAVIYKNLGRLDFSKLGDDYAWPC